MAIANWPSTLPQELLQRGYNQTAKNIALRSPMEVGPAKVRLRATSGIEEVQGNLILTESQVITLWGFYNTDLKCGALRFSWKEPVTLQSREFRFTDPPKRIMKNGLYDVTLQLEMLP